MRVSPIVLAALAYTSANGATQIPLQVQNALTSIDSVPTTLQLDTVYGDHAAALLNLSAIAGDPTTDTGIRLRAIHALAKYCATTPCGAAELAHQSLSALITANAGEQAGAALVVLRGAIEAIGPQRVATDLPLLLPFLDHASRDIRAATAHALRDLCNSQAINPLRNRQQHETSQQVRLAITEALRILGQPGC